MYSGCIARPIEFSAISTASDVLTGYGAGNAATFQPREQAVFTESPAVIDIDLGAATDVRLAALVATNATAWSLKGAASQGALTAAPNIVSEALTGAGEGVERIFYSTGAHTHRWWRLTLTGPTNLYLGRVILADPFIPLHSFSFGQVKGRQPGLKYKVAAGGALHPEANAQFRTWALNFESIRDDEFGDIDVLEAYAAPGGALLFCADPASTNPEDDSLYALMDLQGGATRRSVNRWRAPIQLLELT